MLTKEQAQVGAKIAIPTQKTAGTDYEYFAAELAGSELRWDSAKQEIYRVPHRNQWIRKGYKLPYLLIAAVSTFADSPATCVILKRADEMEYLGADTFASEDLVLYKE